MAESVLSNDGLASEKVRILPVPEYRVLGTYVRSPVELEAASQGKFRIFGTWVDDIAPPVDWNANPHDSASWQAQLHTMRYLDVLKQVDSRNSESNSIKRGVALILDWIQQNPRGGSGVCRYAWLDKVVGDRAAYVGWFFRRALHDELLSPTEARTVYQSLLEHAQFLVSDSHYTSVSNHGLFQDVGLILLAHYLDFHPEREMWHHHALERFLSTLSRHVSKSGVHLEHSPGYHLDMVLLVKKLRDICTVNDEHLDSLYNTMLEALGWFITPANTVAPLGDTDWGMPIPEWAHTTAQKTSGLRFFDDAGYVSVRTDDAHLIVTGAYHSRVHKHADDLSFVLYHRKTEIVGEGGKYAYDSHHTLRKYTVSEESHNVLGVDNQRNLFTSVKPTSSAAIRSVQQRGTWTHIVADNLILDRALHIKHRRWFFYDPRRALVVVDYLISRETRNYRRWLHLGPAISLEESGLLTKDGSVIALVQDISPEAADCVIQRGATSPTTQGWTFPRFGVQKPVWTIEWKAAAANALLGFAIKLMPETPCSIALRESHRCPVLEADGESFDLTKDEMPYANV